MALVVSDRIKETTTTTGTGTYTLAGAVTGFETFTANLSNGDTTYYACSDGTDFEVGLGTFTSSGTTLARTTILASTNSNNAVSWSSGTRTIFCTLPAAKAVFKDASNNINGTFVGNITGDVTGNADTASAVAADNISAGDAAVNLTTTSGNITIDAQGNDTDIIFKGTDGGSDITALTLDMSSGGLARFNGGVESPSYFWMKTDGNTALYAGANFEVRLGHVHNTGFALTNAGTGTPNVELQFVDSNEAIGSDGTNLKLTSGGNEITVPNSGADTMTLNAATQTLTNKTLTSPKINEDVAVTATATEINKLDGVTATTTELNYVDVTTLGTVEASKAVTADANGDVNFPDLDILSFGTGKDLKIFHNPNHSVIQEQGSGSLFIDASNLTLRNGGGSANYATFADGGAAELNHNNVKKFETTSTGATVTGTLVSDVISIADGSSTGDRLTIGTNNDFFIYHDTTPQTVIANVAGQGPIKIQGKFGEQSIIANQDGAVELYHNNVKKVETTSDGATVTGDLEILSTDAGASEDPNLVLYRNSSSPADDDQIGTIQFKGRNDNSQDVVYGEIQSSIQDASDTTEDSALSLQVRKNGSATTFVNLSGASGRVNIQQDLFLTTGIDITFEGATSNANETTLTVADPSQDNTVTLPDATGTVLTTGNSDTPTTTTSSSDADFVLVDDGGTMKKITPSNLGITSGGASKGFAVAMAIAL